MAARIRKQLGVEVAQVAGSYGEFTVLVGDRVLMTGGPLGWLGVLPTARDVVASVKAAIGS